MIMRQIKIPNFYNHDIEETGGEFMNMYASHLPGTADRYIYAKKIVDTYSGDELAQYIAEILLAYDFLRFKDCKMI